MKKRYWGALALVGTGVAAFAAGVRIAPVLRPQLDTTFFAQAAKSYNALVERDKFGVPHISGPRDADVAFGLGYAHSEDDFSTIMDAIVTTRGRAAETKGKEAAVGDSERRL
jgi:acyl-homoserine-lactone acylase